MRCWDLNSQPSEHDSSHITIKPGPGPINILQHKFYTTLIFKHSDWRLKFVNQ